MSAYKPMFVREVSRIDCPEFVPGNAAGHKARRLIDAADSSFAGSGDRQRLMALCAEDIEWIIPGENWALAGTRRGHAGLEDLLQKASGLETSFPQPPEFVAQGDRVLMIGLARGKVKQVGHSKAILCLP